MNCKFCNQPLSYPDPDWTQCDTCNTAYDTWYAQIYYLNHPKYRSVMMDNYSHQTTIYSISGKHDLTIPGTWPNTHPNNIHNLIDRLTNLKVFY